LTASGKARHLGFVAAKNLKVSWPGQSTPNSCKPVNPALGFELFAALLACSRVP